MMQSEAVAAVRHFNRFYTRKLGVLQQKDWLDSPFTLAEARVLYEISHRAAPTASEIGAELGLDAGYLSRILRRFQHDGLIRRETSTADGRRSHLSLTARGREAFAPLEARTKKEVGAMLDVLPQERQQHLLVAMRTIEETLQAPAADTSAAPFILRDPKPGDLGWVVSRHATFYFEHYGWREPFEAMCAEIVADFGNTFDPQCERCWIAERNGENAGSIFLVKETDDIARLRLLLVDPSSQGLGIGKALVDASIAFARETGYRRVTLWTHQILTAARAIYRSRGFVLTESKPHKSWGPEVIGETWDLDLIGLSSRTASTDLG
jgi:DNA-binding MarR family transcriptional regulator/GNAT superfamily N-acetyltransferase